MNTKPSSTGNRHKPTLSTRTQVLNMAAWLRRPGIERGFTQDQIARRLGIDPATLKKHYWKELEEGQVGLAERVGDALLQGLEDANPQITLHLAKSALGINPPERVESEQTINVQVMIGAKTPEAIDIQATQLPSIESDSQG